MANHPEVDDARKLGKRDGLKRCIVFFVTDEGKYGYASWGRTKRLCDDTRDLADEMYETMGSGLARRHLGTPGGTDG